MCYWHHWTLHNVRISFNTNPGDNMATAFLKMLRNDGCEPDPLHVKATLPQHTTERSTSLSRRL